MALNANELASGPGWSVTDVLCTAGPGERPFEERHEQVSVAAVVSGTFQYRTRQGRATMTPGALLLGNAGACFECGHEHGVGDRCFSFRFEPGWFENVAASVRGVRRADFPAPRLAASDALMCLIVEVETSRGDAFALEEVALRMAGAAVLGQERASPRSSSARDERRISEVIRLVEGNPGGLLTLAGLARTAAMSPYHFLRTFRAVAGVTPHQFILRQRMRQAAVRLRHTADPVADIAFDSGFGDISTFNRRFHRIMGMPPRAWRVAGKRHAA